ncbi:uncharacterized protein VICG_01487, partial [Vittaforma corneae ATCC 50505]
VIFSSRKIYQKLINPKNSVLKTLLGGLKPTALFILLPIIFLAAFISFDLHVRNTHSQESLGFSLPFQSSLKNFDITQGFINSHSPNNSLETDLYVMDRSIISVMSKKHNAFFSIGESVEGSKKFTRFCEIHKIHGQDFDDEEPRFIKDGDYVKFKHIEEDKFVGMKRNDSDQKFVELSAGTFESDEDLWQIVTDGYLKTRFSEVEFKNVNSGDQLCAKMVKDQPSLNASFYSDVKSRVFYIADNVNHDYFKANFHDYRTRITTNEYPTHSFFKKLQEYLSTVNLKFNSVAENASGLKKSWCMMPGLLSIFILLINGIAARRWKSKISIKESTVVFTATYTMACLFSPVIGVRAYIIASFGSLSLYSIISDLADMKKGKVVFASGFEKDKNE